MDMVHGGGFLDSLGCSGFRMHCSFPLIQSHCGVGNPPVIEWHEGTSHKDPKYSKKLVKVDGEPFENIPKKGDRLLAADVLQLIVKQVETQNKRKQVSS